MNSATKITQIRAEPPYILYVTLEGKEIKLDLTPLVEKREAFWRLKNFGDYYASRRLLFWNINLYVFG